MRFLAVVLLMPLSVALADEIPAAGSDELHAAIRNVLPNAADADITPSPVAGISEVVLGTQVFYLTNDGRFLLGGPLISTADRSNLSEHRLDAVRSQLLADSPDLQTFHYPAKPARHAITVFTDIDCPYCRRLHTDLPDYQAAGIDVTYVMLPRAGKDSASYRKTVSAACADDPETAITAAMQGSDPVTAQCANPIDEHMALARRMNVTSTPTIVLADGSVVLGHKKPGEMLRLLENKAGR